MLRSHRRQIQSVTPATFGATGPWSCSACGGEFGARSSFLIELRHADGREFRFVVCPPCAEEHRPHRIVVDRDRLAGEVDLGWLRDCVEEIAAHRSREDERRLRLRATDVDELAAMVDTTPVTLVRSLAERRVAEPVG